MSGNRLRLGAGVAGRRPELQVVGPEDDESARSGQSGKPLSGHVHHALRHAGENRRNVIPDRRSQIGLLPVVLGTQTGLNPRHLLSSAAATARCEG